MKNKLLKMASLFITPILILFLLTASLTYRYAENHFELKQDESYKCFNLKNDQSESSDNNFLLAADSDSKSSEIELIPGGESIGVRLSCRGILVVGFTNIQTSMDSRSSSNIQIGDIITEVDSKSVKTSKELIDKVKNYKNDQVTLTILRNDEEKYENVRLYSSEDGDKKIGLWVRDTTAGVGTMTFYNKKNNIFGALGHPVIDADTNQCFQISGGSLLKSSVISIRKGEKGNPGELKGIFIDDKEPIGSIESNTNCGIFGKYKSKAVAHKKALKAAKRTEIEEGPAKIITTIDDEGPKEYDINIEKLYTQNEPGPKSMIIKITDKELLLRTGGIVQGMSGSPIIQNNKIVGAVTHVLINKPDTGYGIYIDWMLQETNNIN